MRKKIIAIVWKGRFEDIIGWEMDLEQVEARAERIDHLGVIAGTIDDLGIVELIDSLIKTDKREKVSAGQGVKAMVSNTLGFTSEPLTLTPQFFENRPLDLLIGPGLKPNDFNRHKLGRVLDDIEKYGCEKLFTTISIHVCLQEEVDITNAYCDTTSYSVSGEYNREADLGSVKLVHGYSKDKRQDMKQVVQELITTSDGGIPLMCQLFDGNASDSVIMRKRVESLQSSFVKSGPRCFHADSKLYSKETAPFLNNINFITRVPATIKMESDFIMIALSQESRWHDGKSGYRFQDFDASCFGIQHQRFIVIYSKQAHERSKKSIERAITKEKAKAKKDLSRLQKQKFHCPSDAKTALASLAKQWKFHQVDTETAEEKKCYAGRRGRPGKDNPSTLQYAITATVKRDEVAINTSLQQKSCFVLATNLDREAYPAESILTSYKGLDKTEKGFAFLKGNTFFASSIFLKNPGRIEAMITVMTLSLLVYSIAQRRLRRAMAKQQQTLPNQIQKEISNPTLQWVFKMLNGIDYITIKTKDSSSNTEVPATITLKVYVDRLDDLRIKILNFFSPGVKKIYAIS